MWQSNNAGKSLWWNLVFVVLYVPLAMLGLSLSIPPGNVTPIYPAAGLAFGVYLLFGARLLPGILVGAMVGNLLPLIAQGWTWPAQSAALLIGLGEVAASVIAGSLLLRLSPVDQLLQRPRRVLWLFGVSLCWFISPSIGVSALWLHGLILWHDVPYTWLTWWLGDAVGIMLVTPLLLQTRRCLVAPTCDWRLPPGLLPAALAYGLLVIGLELVPWPVAFVLIPATLLMVIGHDSIGAAVASILAAVLVVGGILLGSDLYVSLPLNERLLLVQLLIGVNSFTAYLLAAHTHTIRRLHTSMRAAREASERDPLTGLLNRRGFERYANRALHQARDGDKGLSLVMLDIDDFKSINDSLGHDFGDQVLSAFGKTLEALLRGSDHAARLGGDEFVLLLATSDLGELESILQRLDRQRLTTGPDKTLRFTTSGGVATSREGRDLDELLSRADKRLYQAKQQGKARLVWPDGTTVADHSVD